MKDKLRELLKPFPIQKNGLKLEDRIKLGREKSLLFDLDSEDGVKKAEKEVIFFILNDLEELERKASQLAKQRKISYSDFYQIAVEARIWAEECGWDLYDLPETKPLAQKYGLIKKLEKIYHLLQKAYEKSADDRLRLEFFVTFGYEADEGLPHP